jgi:hypothetical protein
VTHWDDEDSWDESDLEHLAQEILEETFNYPEHVSIDVARLWNQTVVRDDWRFHEERNCLFVVQVKSTRWIEIEPSKVEAVAREHAEEFWSFVKRHFVTEERPFNGSIVYGEPLPEEMVPVLAEVFSEHSLEFGWHTVDKDEEAGTEGGDPTAH